MVAEIDIWRAARQMIVHHGRDALIEAERKADAMAASGDMEGFAVWKRIAWAVEEQTMSVRPEDVREY